MPFVTKYTIMCDPPSGWKYGFPKPYTFDTNGWNPEEDEEAFHAAERQWFLDNGYPQNEIDKGMLKYVRFWEEENNVWENESDA